jgi:hypothetical protein
MHMHTHLTKFSYNLEIFVSDEWNTFPVQCKDVLVCGFLGERGGRWVDYGDGGELRERLIITGGLWS